ncbi:hypothetical protein LP7551_02727 [Roseibium album]|nr:hypothetical protein LP7551_02727 [Roseibium album]
MRYLFRNLHVFVFVFVSVFSALMVANGPDRTVRLVQPLVEDAIELRDLAVGAYNEVSRTDWQTATDEAVSLYVATLRMPTMLFERLAGQLKEVDRDLSRSSMNHSDGNNDQATL